MFVGRNLWIEYAARCADHCVDTYTIRRCHRCLGKSKGQTCLSVLVYVIAHAQTGSPRGSFAHLRFQRTIPDLVHQEHVRHEAEVEAVSPLLSQQQHEALGVCSKPLELSRPVFGTNKRRRRATTIEKQRGRSKHLVPQHATCGSHAQTMKIRVQRWCVHCSSPVAAATKNTHEFGSVCRTFAHLFLPQNSATHFSPFFCHPFSG